MDVEQKLRMKSAMVLFEIERCVGRLVTSITSDGAHLPERQIYNISQRAGSSQPEKIVEASYLGEILDLAVSATQDRPENNWVKRLKEFSQTLRLFEIRNAIAHPNRPFPEYYWHRLVAVATDPCIGKLEFEAVSQAYQAASRNKIDPPPEEWLEGTRWSLPNNLPDLFDHDITGLIGRTKEKQEVLSLLSNSKVHFLALVARGGIGKTALALDILKDIVTDPESLEWTDYVLYITSKLDRLTHEGVEQIKNDVQTIHNVKIAIMRELLDNPIDITWESFCKSHDSQRVLLCIDNLETLIRDSPSDFSSFYYTLPPSWTVLVTSRITVDGAHTVRLRPLTEDGAAKFANIYSSRRGFKDISQTDIHNIIEASDYNPLAIRLTIDTLINNGNLHEAISQTKESIVEYSYQNLVNTLSDSTRKVLECMFVVGEPIGRSEMIRLLNLDIDSVSEAISELFRTSLCTRIPSDTVEQYRLGSSVRELLLLYPADETARREIHSELRKVKRTEIDDRKYQKENEVSPLSAFYVPQELSPAVRDVALRSIQTVFKSEFSRRDAVDLLQTVKGFIQSGTADPSLYRVVGMLLIRLNDRENGKEWLQKAVSTNTDDPAAALYLSRIYRQDNDLEMAIDVAEPLFVDGWHSKDGVGNDGIEVVRSYLLPLIWLGRYDEVISETNDWIKKRDLSEVYGTLRIDALRRKAVHAYYNSRIDSIITECISIAQILLQENGYTGYLVDTSIKIYDEFCKIIDKGYELNKESASALAEFTDRHFINLCQSHKRVDLDDEESRLWIRNVSIEAKSLGIETLEKKQWKSYVGDKVYDSINEHSGIETHIYSIPTREDGERDTYLFTRDSNDKRFFVHRSAIAITSKEWNMVKPGDKIGIIDYESPDQPNKLPVAKKAYYFKS